MAGWVVVWMKQCIMPENGSLSNMKGYGIVVWMDQLTIHGTGSDPPGWMGRWMGGWMGGRVVKRMDHWITLENG